MHPSTLLVTMAAAAATVVSAIPFVENRGLSSHTALSPRGGFFSKPKPAKEPAGPPETCPTITTRKGTFTDTGDGHCCQPGRKDALNCCSLGKTPRLPGTSEYPCRSKFFQTAEAWQDMHDCTKHIITERECGTRGIPRVIEIWRETNPQRPKNLSPKPEPKPAPPSNVPKAVEKALEQKGRFNPGTKKPTPGKSRLGKHPNGNPAPADSESADSKPAA